MKKCSFRTNAIYDENNSIAFSSFLSNTIPCVIPMFPTRIHTLYPSTVSHTLEIVESRYYSGNVSYWRYLIGCEESV